MIGVLFAVALTCLASTIDANQPTTVTTKYGDIMGYQTDTARVFYGIPFAQPPVNNLRYINRYFTFELLNK